MDHRRSGFLDFDTSTQASGSQIQLLGMQEVHTFIEALRQSTCPVLILGESGTGKELVARAIHAVSPRAKNKFTPVDCASLTSSLIESELFGHVRGAFTSATDAGLGLFASANGGTLFLDEIGELPVESQAKFLRAMQERVIRPVGSTREVPVDVRIISATNREIERRIKQGAFRQDLFFRLNVVQLRLPPLRERRGEIPLLVSHFLEKYAEPSAPHRTVDASAMQLLMTYDWPGNVRELENVIHRAVVLGGKTILQPDDLPPELQLLRPLSDNDTGEESVCLDVLERRAILRALKETSGDRAAASRLLGIGKTTLYRKIKEFDSPLN
jgi:DNA-binding NtrC family response regulator